MYKYNCKPGIRGVYKITNKVNGKSYIGASANAANRMGQHMRIKVAERYKHLEFYEDILNYGHQGFSFELLEECTKEEMLEKEQYHYDHNNHEYNLVRPCEVMFQHPEVRARGIAKSQDMDHRQWRKKLYNTAEYQTYFKYCRSDLKPVSMFKNDSHVMDFVSLRSAARWLNENTNFKGKNKTSKVKAVCDGERPSAYGYIFKYSDKSVETILERSTLSIDTIREAVNSGSIRSQMI